MCRRSTKILRAIDLLGRLDFQDMTQTPEDELPVPLDQAMFRMPMRTRSGRALIGFQAVRRALAQTPLGFLPALVLYLPGVSAIGEKVYDRVAANRAREGACAVAPGSRD